MGFHSDDSRSGPLKQLTYDRTWNAAGSCGGQSRAFPVARQWWFLLLDPDGSGDFPFLLRFLATNDSLKRLGIFCQSDARTQSDGTGTLCKWPEGHFMLLPAALKYAPNSAAFFFLTAGDTTDTQLCLSVFWCGVTQFAKHHFFWRARYQYRSFSQQLYYVRCYVILIHFAQRAFCSDDKWQSFAQSGVPFLKGKSVIWEMSFFEHFCLARIKAAVFMGACSLLVQRESVWLSELHHGKLAKSAPDKSYFILLQEIDQQVAIWSSRRESKSESNWVVGLTQIARFDSGSSAKNKTQRFAFSSFEMSDDLWFVSRVGTWKIQIYLARASMSCRKIQQTLTIQAEIRFPPQKTCKNPFKLKWSIWVWTWFLQGTAMYAGWLFLILFCTTLFGLHLLLAPNSKDLSNNSLHSATNRDKFCCKVFVSETRDSLLHPFVQRQSDALNSTENFQQGSPELPTKCYIHYIYM